MATTLMDRAASCQRLEFGAQVTPPECMGFRGGGLTYMGNSKYTITDSRPGGLR